jgi:hypothetical protein
MDLAFEYETITLFGQASQLVLLASPMIGVRPHNPEEKFPSVWADPISLATTFGISKLISFPSGT